MTNRQQIIAGHVNSLSISKNGSILSAMVTGGPVSAQGRGVRVVLADDTLRGMLAHLALDARWAAALMALGQSARVLASSRELQHFPGTVGERAELTERMKQAMDTQDADLAVDQAQGTQTRLRQGSHSHPRTPSWPEPVAGCRTCEPVPNQYDNDGTDRQTYEQPNCGSTRPHDPHFHSPIGGLTLNCPGVAGAHRLNLPATAPEGEEAIYAALAAYGGTIVHAEAGCVTELVRPDGTVAARVVPA